MGHDSPALRVNVLAPAKVNLSLFLGPTRQDGRHELVTLFQSLSLCDELDVRCGSGDDLDRVRCAPPIEGENIATRALAALRARGWDGPPLDVQITKRIPVAAGMAGGSADAAAVLRAAMSVAPGRAEEVEQIAAELGADVPAQLLPGVSLATGAGELVEHFEPLAEHAYAVVPSPFSLSTPEVYREADRLKLPRSSAALAELYGELGRALASGHPPVRPPADLLVNDLQPAAVSLCPWCAVALDDLRGVGAQNAMVSGSGPTVVGIWWGPDAPALADGATAALAERYPGTVAARPVNAQFALPSLT
jgi:4-diphosphocytidyl-2-C-methyl-D-erythritol kinase